MPLLQGYKLSLYWMTKEAQHLLLIVLLLPPVFPLQLSTYVYARFFRNPSSYTRYGQNGWYPRRGPTTRLAALDAERIPNRKGTSRCVNDDPAPGQG